MPYWSQETNGTSIKSLDNYVTQQASSAQAVEFHELEPAVVLDVVIDSSHHVFKNTEIGEEPWEADLQGEKPDKTDKDFTWIGRALVRLIYSDKKVEKERLVWAIPMESNISEYPLVNELVIVGKYLGRYYYSRKLNVSNLVNHNVDFSKEVYLSGKPNKEFGEDEFYSGPLSKTTIDGGIFNSGVAGRYFWINRNIRSIKRHEGDLVIESRFGQSIKFGAYDGDSKNNVGKYLDYNGKMLGAGINPVDNSQAGGGNPMILIRNRQRTLIPEGKTLKLINSPNPAIVKSTTEEKNVGGYIEEDINHDGSSIHITSGQTISKWVTTCFKKMFSERKEEVLAFSPAGCSNFVYPQLDGDQIVMQSDRLILSARYGEMFNYSKKRYSIVTDSEYTVDAHQQIVLTTNTKTVINSPAIYLGEYDMTDEPVLLGQTTVNWLYELCNWLLEHTHWYIHSHPDAGSASPNKTQVPVQIAKLQALRDKLHTLMSRRVFVTGGGLAPGQNGGKITDGVEPTNISVSGGSGVPGGWKGKNYRTS